MKQGSRWILPISEDEAELVSVVVVYVSGLVKVAPLNRKNEICYNRSLVVRPDELKPIGA